MQKKEKQQIFVQQILVEIEWKNIKHMYLRVKSPSGSVFVSVPMHVKNEEIESFVNERIEWIKKHQMAYTNLPSKKNRQYITGETICIWGEEIPLEVESIVSGKEKIVDQGNRIKLYVKVGSDLEKREKIVLDWYREQLKIVIPELFEIWESKVGVNLVSWNIKNMKTRWGTCNVVTKKIWISLQLAKRPPECVEYVVVHELVHLLEASHNARFKMLMTQFLPTWKARKKLLNDKKENYS